MLEEFTKTIHDWALKIPSIESVILVGSYAKGTYNENSDIDLCILTNRKNAMLKNQAFLNHFGSVEKKQIEYYGACTSIRVWYKHNLEVEFGLVEPSWIAKPYDQGTLQVLQGGYRVIIDKNQHFLDFGI